MTKSFLEFVNEHLLLFEEIAGKSGILLFERPIEATKFLCKFVEETGPNDEVIKFDASKDSHVEMYFYILKNVSIWYSNRYGEAFARISQKTIKGIVLIWGACFLMDIPINYTKPGKTEKTFWVHFPVSVHDHEDSMDWLLLPPNLDRLSSGEVSDIRIKCDTIAAKVRSIYNKLIAMPSDDFLLDGLISNVFHNMEGAAANLFIGRGIDYNQSVYFNVHMAIECAFKALLKNKQGCFERGHDLRSLYIQCKKFLPLMEESKLASIPEWSKVNKFRYGEYAKFDIFAYNDAYKAMLDIVDKALEPMVTWIFRDASFELKRMK